MRQVLATTGTPPFPTGVSRGVQVHHTPPLDTMSGVTDVISYISRLDLQAIQSLQSRAENGSANLTDEELALALFAEEAGGLLSLVKDFATDEDRIDPRSMTVLEELEEMEEAARYDHLVALAISQGNPIPPPPERRPRIQSPLTSYIYEGLPHLQVRNIQEPLLPVASSSRRPSTPPRSGAAAHRHQDEPQGLRPAIVQHDGLYGPIAEAESHLTSAETSSRHGLVPRPHATATGTIISPENTASPVRSTRSTTLDAWFRRLNHDDNNTYTTERGEAGPSRILRTPSINLETLSDQWELMSPVEDGIDDGFSPDPDWRPNWADGTPLSSRAPSPRPEALSDDEPDDDYAAQDDPFTAYASSIPGEPPFFDEEDSQPGTPNPPDVISGTARFTPEVDGDEDRSEHEKPPSIVKILEALARNRHRAGEESEAEFEEEPPYDSDSEPSEVGASPHSDILCTICGDEVWEPYTAPCGHAFDSGCIADMFRRATHDESLYPPRCCQQRIDISDVTALLLPSVASAFVAKAKEYDTTDRVYCHQQSCSAFLGATTAEPLAIYCPSCPGSATCGMCKAEAHPDTKCSDTRELNQLALDMREQHLWQRCYSCGHLVDKVDGCYHITCICRAQFCYLCAAPWKTCGCDHFFVPPEE